MRWLCDGWRCRYNQLRSRRTKSAPTQLSPHATILLNGKPVGLMFSDDCEEPFTDRMLRCGSRGGSIV